MHSRCRYIYIVVIVVIAALAVGVLSYDITKDKCCFAVGYQHLDTQWGHPREYAYKSQIPNTLHTNFALFRKYPTYILSFSGAQRYWMVERANEQLFGNFKAGDWDTLKAYIEKGNWYPCGGMIDEIDVNIPCAEVIGRSILYGNGYFEDRFGKRSLDIVLPDCFGFGYALPTIGRHFGIRGFSASKYSGWGGWQSLSNAQSIARWYGVDGSFLYAALRPSEYYGGVDLNTSYGNAVYQESGMWIVFDYYSLGGDGGGGPPDSLVDLVCNMPNGQLNGVYYFPASSDSLFRQLVALEEAGNPIVDKLASWDNELVMMRHGVGCYTSRGRVKSLFRNMELSGLSTEPAAVTANKVAEVTYPQQQLWRAWFKGIMHAMHDDVTGTSDTMAYWCKWDGAYYDLDSQITSFTDVRSSSNTAIAGMLNTQVSAAGAVPLMVYNPLGLDRQDVVEATVTFSSASQYVKVVGPDGLEVPSQVIDGDGTTELTILFPASVPSMGYSVYEVSPSSQACSIQTGLSVSSDGKTMSNNDLTVSIDNTGDISQIVDKKGGDRDLFQSASRWEFRPDETTNFPAWEIRREDALCAPTAIVDGTPVITVVEQGPVRVSVKVTRNKSGSSFTHYYRLCSGEAGRLVIVDNSVDWQSRGNLLKASFYLACSNTNATYSLGVGTIDRPNSGTDDRYEVPAQQWATIDNGTFGVAIMNRFKYGWSKLANNNLLLTLIHSPIPDGANNNSGDVGMNIFSYAIYGYSGGWKNGRIDEQCQRYQLPLIAMQTTAHAATAPFDKTLSFVRISDPSKGMIMCLKKAEKSNDYVVRVHELVGGSASLKLLFTYDVTAAKSTNGMEDDEGATTITPGGANNNEVAFSIDKYQLKTFKVTLGSNYIGSTAIGKGPIPGSIPSRGDRIIKIMVPTGTSHTGVTFRLHNGEKVRSVVCTDIKGRIVRVLSGESTGANTASRIIWNGRNAADSPVSAGIYIITVVTDCGKKHALMKVMR